MIPQKQIFVSCPGKILVSGGYSILNEGNIGICYNINLFLLRFKDSVLQFQRSFM